MHPVMLLETFRPPPKAQYENCGEISTVCHLCALGYEVKNFVEGDQLHGLGTGVSEERG